MIAKMDIWSSVAKVYDPLKAGSIDGTDTEPHDRAIVRAMNAKYKPNNKVKGDPQTTVFVGRLNPQTTEDTLLTVFEKFGKIKSLRLVRDLVTGFSKTYAFVEYERVQSADEAVFGKRIEVDDHQLLVEFECERTMPGWVPRRLGGGFSGKKESGQLRFGGRDKPWRKPIILQNEGRGNISSLKDRRRNFDEGRGDRRDYNRERSTYGERGNPVAEGRGYRDSRGAHYVERDRGDRVKGERHDYDRRNRHRNERASSDGRRGGSYDRHRRDTPERSRGSREEVGPRDRIRDRSRERDRRDRKHQRDFNEDYQRSYRYKSPKQERRRSRSRSK